MLSFEFDIEQDALMCSFLLLGMVNKYANEFRTKENQKLTEIKKN